jgi:hypothetical protein
MPAKATGTARVRGGASRARGAGHASLERLTLSVEAAQTALKDLRKELGKGTRDVLGDLDMTLRDARKNLRSVSRTVSRDLEGIQQAVTAGKPARPRTAGSRKAAAGAGTPRKRTTTAKGPTAQKRTRPAKATMSAAKETGAAGADQRDLR